MKDRIIMVGAGIAALSAAQAIRDIDKDVEIQIYGEERYLPYKRIRLTKDLLGDLNPDTLSVKKRNWYTENNISLFTGKTVTAIDVPGHSIRLDDGSIVKYTKLLLANGARNNTPPINGIDKNGVFTLRSLDDAHLIIAEARKAEDILIIGGGVLGLEIAWCLKQINKRVTIAEALPRLMPRQLNEKASQLLQQIIEEHGLKIHTGTQIKEITGDSQVQGYITDSGSQGSCQMIIHSTGIKPNIELVKDTGIKTNRGVLVNDKMETNMPDVYAAGDIAEYEGIVYGLWNVASVQGETAGYNMLGINRRYEVPAAPTLMNAYDTAMFSIGDVRLEAADKAVTTYNPDDRTYKTVLLRDKRVVGAIFLGSNNEFPLIKRAIEAKTDVGAAYEKDLGLTELLLLLKQPEPIPV